MVATATLALQHQLVERDLPRLVEALEGQPGVATSYAVLKGRSNYACLHRIREGVPDEQGVLVDVPEGSMGKQVLELRKWAEDEAKDKGTGERDGAPRHTDRLWRQVSVSARECLGKARCAFGEECFAERAKERAAEAQLVITNHSLLAIDAIEGIPMIPEYDVVVVDEAHEVTARITQAATDELSVSDVERAARRAQRYVEDTQADDLDDAAGALEGAIADAPPPAGSTACRRTSATRWCWCATPPGPASGRCPRRATPTRTPAAPRRGRGSRRSSTTPSGWPRT